MKLLLIAFNMFAVQVFTQKRRRKKNFKSPFKFTIIKKLSECKMWNCVKKKKKKSLFIEENKFP